MKKISEETLARMRELRKAGYSYTYIERALGISRWSSIQYLRDLEPEGEKSAITTEWKNAEYEAKAYLSKRGFQDIHDLNTISPSPFWDILARRENMWWLIDVTVSATKSVGAKIRYTVDGYVHAILYRDMNTKNWTLMRLTLEPVDDDDLKLRRSKVR